ncbi:MAG: hypothetical protein HF314_05950 [Ignavibacteria bacterium]|jgi:precorrin-6B methylase 2|nr:hypothetical protein [Ignavibacteria bacterium]MCU7502595.1 hypothetical protein [Ignavibacteria bacterium]MCU7515202.1 hypothetical protein [Ignavibacteria bacterium]
MTQEELEELLKDGAKDFIRLHAHEDPDLLALKFRGNGLLPVRAIAEEIRCMKKAAVKLPELSKYGLLYEKTSLEQASSEFTARYKAGLCKGDRIIDLTGGLGIDDIFFSGSFREVFYCEKNSILVDIFRHNLARLGIGNIRINEGDSTEMLKSFPKGYFDLIYADPARRDESRRFIGLKSCSPDVVEILPLMLEKSQRVLIKASPAIEIEEVKKQFGPCLKEFTVVSLDNECKEVLLFLEKDAAAPEGEPIIKSVLLDSATGSVRIYSGKSSLKDERKVSPEILHFLYEPEGSLIKARLTKSIAEEYSLFFVNRNIDYLTSNQLKSDFPGRAFEVKNVLPYKAKEIKRYLLKEGIVSANLSRRDFPDSPEKIRKILNLKDGGDDYLFFTKNNSGKPVVIFCKKAQNIYRGE